MTTLTKNTNLVHVSNRVVSGQAIKGVRGLQRVCNKIVQNFHVLEIQFILLVTAQVVRFHRHFRVLFLNNFLDSHFLLRSRLRYRLVDASLSLGLFDRADWFCPADFPLLRFGDTTRPWSIKFVMLKNGLSLTRAFLDCFEKLQ